MKTTKSILLTIALGAFLMMNASAQKQHEVTVTSGQKIVVENLLGKILVKNHNGTSLIIKTDAYGELPEKAKGLKEIYSGSVDNTGMGIAVKSSGKSIFVSGASKRSEDASYTFLVPKGVNMSIDYSSPFGYETIEVEGFSGEFEAKTLNEDISLQNVTGPMSIHTINGDVTADFSSLSQTSPTAITTINGDLEINIPASTKTTIDFGTMHGEVYTDCDIEFEKKNDEKHGDMKMIGGNSNNTGKINGGGVELSLSTINGSIYLRKK